MFSDAISYHTNAVLNTCHSIIFLLRSQTASFILRIFISKSILNWSRRFRLSIIWSRPLFLVSLLLMRSPNEWAICRWRVLDYLFTIWVLVTPAIHRIVVFNNFSEWVLLKNRLPIYIRIECFDDIVRRSSYKRRFHSKNASSAFCCCLLWKSLTRDLVLILFHNSYFVYLLETSEGLLRGLQRDLIRLFKLWGDISLSRLLVLNSNGRRLLFLRISFSALGLGLSSWAITEGRFAVLWGFILNACSIFWGWLWSILSCVLADKTSFVDST